MIYTKKGLSTVVTTLIIILLVLVAVGIIWVVVRGVIETGADQIDTSSKCPLIDLRITNVSDSCDGTGTCTVDVERRSGGGDIDGAIVVISSATTSSTPYENGVNIPQLGNAQLTANAITGGEVARVAAYFEDSQGVNQACPNFAERSF